MEGIGAEDGAKWVSLMSSRRFSDSPFLLVIYKHSQTTENRTRLQRKTRFTAQMAGVKDSMSKTIDGMDGSHMS
jgi:hypothetical protein